MTRKLEIDPGIYDFEPYIIQIDYGQERNFPLSIRYLNPVYFDNTNVEFIEFYHKGKIAQLAHEGNSRVVDYFSDPDKRHLEITDDQGRRTAYCLPAWILNDFVQIGIPESTEN